VPPLTDADGRLLPGTVLGGQYRIERPIGAGGMGTVYAAERLGGERRPVALKVIGDEHTTDPQTVARFQREGQVMAGTRHANIVEVLEVGQADGRWYLAMELLEGTNLADAIAARGSFDTAGAVPIVVGILDALTAAHGRDVVHRDLKPENVFLCGSPAEARVKVLDFGVAKVVGKSAHEQLTRSGTVVGTPEFMSPEQAMGTTVDARSDLYAVGCIAYAMLCGRPPFIDDWPMRVVMKQAFEPHAPPSRVRPELAGAGEVDQFMARALAKKPDERFQSAGEMRAALDALGATPRPR
jgi:serine/threonine protein kinase